MVIKDNAYIANNCLIVPNVTIGSNVLVAAGSVVKKSVPNGVVVGGNPAKVLSNIKVFEEKMISENVASKRMNKTEKEKYLLSLPDSVFIKR